MGGSKTTKFVNVFSLESFPLYGRSYYFMSTYTYSEAFLHITIDFVRVEFEEGWLNEQFEKAISDQFDSCHKLLCLFTRMIKNSKVNIENNLGHCCNMSTVECNIILL